MDFKFKYIDDNGDETGMFSKRGSFDDEKLALDKESYALSEILKTEIKFDTLLIFVADEDEEVRVVVIKIKKGNVKELAKQINIKSSESAAERRKALLASSGSHLTFRSVICPKCSATTDLTDFKESKNIQCTTCEFVFSKNNMSVVESNSLGVCEECHYYSQPIEFTTFYFYFLLFIYGWNYQKKFMCHSCMKGEAWKMFFGNFFFVLGLPLAIIQLIRAYKGASVGSVPGLDSANKYSCSGSTEIANQKYEEILRIDSNPGILYNLGLNELNAEDMPRAQRYFEKSLENCSNYFSAYSLLRYCYEETGNIKELERLDSEWESRQASSE